MKWKKLHFCEVFWAPLCTSPRLLREARSPVWKSLMLMKVALKSLGRKSLRCFLLEFSNLFLIGIDGNDWRFPKKKRFNLSLSARQIVRRLIFFNYADFAANCFLIIQYNDLDICADWFYCDEYVVLLVFNCQLIFTIHYNFCIFNSKKYTYLFLADFVDCILVFTKKKIA